MSDLGNRIWNEFWKYKDEKLKKIEKKYAFNPEKDIFNPEKKLSTFWKEVKNLKYLKDFTYVEYDKFNGEVMYKPYVKWIRVDEFFYNRDDLIKFFKLTDYCLQNYKKWWYNIWNNKLYTKPWFSLTGEIVDMYVDNRNIFPDKLFLNQNEITDFKLYERITDLNYFIQKYTNFLNEVIEKM